MTRHVKPRITRLRPGQWVVEHLRVGWDLDVPIKQFISCWSWEQAVGYALNTACKEVAEVTMVEMWRMSRAWNERMH